MQVLLLGATGLVGGRVLEMLLADPRIQKIHLLSRRFCGIENSKIEEFIGSLETMEEKPEAFGVQAVICCLGTTIKKAGSQEKFKQVDYEYPLMAAKVAKTMNVAQYAVVTALGSNSKSKIFYNQVKGELEDQLAKIGFDKLHIVRPSIIVGDRKESRPGEAVGILLSKVLNPLLRGPLKKYRGSRVEDIAKVLVSQVLEDEHSSSIEHKVIVGGQ